MLSRVSAYASVSDEVYLDNIFEYLWPAEDANEEEGTYYVVQELLADFLKVIA